MKERWTTCGLLVVALVALAPHRTLTASTSSATEYEVKAAFLYSFAKYVEWPDGAVTEEPFLIGVLGQDPFEQALDVTLQGKSILGHRVAVARFARLDEALRSHILFVAGSDAREQDPVLKALQGRPILSAGESEGFAERGGIVGFRTQDNRVRFEINLRRAEESGLKISSQLLKLATIVTTKP